MRRYNITAECFSQDDSFILNSIIMFIPLILIKSNQSIILTRMYAYNCFCFDICVMYANNLEIICSNSIMHASNLKITMHA